MQWWYRKIEKTEDGYRYAYSHESKDFNGEIFFDKSTKIAGITKKSKFGGDSE